MKRGMRGLAAFIEPVARCRLCWRITMSVFFLIVAVESVILVVSARQFERAALQRLTSDAQLLIEPLLVRARATGIQAPDFDPVLGRYGLRAVAVYARDGRRVAFAGEGPLSESPPNVRNTMATPGEWLEPDHLLTASWRSELDDASTVAVLIDASQVARDLRGYELRILGLVAVIILVVTAGIMATMDFLLLRPMLHLRASTLRAAKEPETAAREAIPTTRSDEMGELITAHNAMLRQIADGKRRDRELAEERARFVTHHDALTGLPNRLALLEFLDGQRGVSGATLFLVNVLQFRVLNATLGPDRGNRLLCRIAARLKTNAAPGDFVAHPGADRFAVVVPGESSAEQASSAAERMLEALVKPFDLGDGVATTLKSCVGIAQRPAEALEGRLLISEAELALTRTYGEDDVTYQFFSDRFAEEAKVRHALTQDLERAIARDELYLVYQPKVTLNSGAVSGAEALIRWYHPRRGLVSPIEFIPIAETTGLIAPIGDLVLRAACTQVRDWLERHGWAPAIAVNLSARQFTDHDLCGRLGSILGDAGIPAEFLELEVTETAAMRDVAKTAQVLAAISKLGVRVSIDDFGTGYSSLTYLHRFAINAIKIDKSFVDGIGLDRDAEAICDAVVSLGKSLGKKIIAEGVETEPQAAFLRERKCDEAQGYLFGKPQSAAEFESAYIAPQARGMPR